MLELCFLFSAMAVLLSIELISLTKSKLGLEISVTFFNLSMGTYVTSSYLGGQRKHQLYEMWCFETLYLPRADQPI